MVTPGGEKMQEQIEAVQRMQEYIEKHLRENISFPDIAKVAPIGTRGYIELVPICSKI